MKYRRLSKEELESLEQDFVTFLASYEITAADWQTFKQEDPEKAESLIDIFSDIVFEKILSSIEFLEHRTSKHLRLFKFEKSKAFMLSLETENDSDLKLDAPIGEILEIAKQTKIELKLLSAEKVYTKSANEEKFILINAGAQILKSSDKWEKLKSLRT